MAQPILALDVCSTPNQSTVQLNTISNSIIEVVVVEITVV